MKLRAKFLQQPLFSDCTGTDDGREIVLELEALGGDGVLDRDKSDGRYMLLNSAAV